MENQFLARNVLLDFKFNAVVNTKGTVCRAEALLFRKSQSEKYISIIWGGRGRKARSLKAWAHQGNWQLKFLRIMSLSQTHVTQWSNAN
jgi:hypothetical protein